MRLLLVLLVLSFTTSSWADCLVPGKLNPDVNQSNLASTVCVPNWTKTVRPPASRTNLLKKQQMKDWKIVGTPQDYEEDHCVPLALGGHPTSPDNLWPQKWTGKCNARVKDALENRLHRSLCKGEITLPEAQEKVHHWCD